MASTAETAAGRTKWVRKRRPRGRWSDRALLRRSGAALGLVALLAGALLLGRWIANRPDPAAARGELAQGLALFRAGNASGARDAVAKAVRDKPDWAMAHALLARLDLATGDGAAAEAELDRARAAGFDVARLHQLQAEALLLQGDADGALAEAARATPRYAAYATRVAARARAANGDLAGGRATLERLLDRSPDDARGWTDLADLRAQSGDVGGALAAISRALALDRSNPRALRLKGELVRGQYGLAASLPWFDAALARDPADVEALLDKAQTLGDLGRYRDMLDATRRAIAARPGDPRPYYLQAVLAARAGKFDLARELMQRTGGALDDLPGAELLGGVLDYQGGAYEQAIGKWRALLDDQPHNAVARRLLGAVLLRSGDADGALDVLQPLAARSDADSYTLALAGRALEAEGRRDAAAAWLDRAANPRRMSPLPFAGGDDPGDLAAAVDAAPGDPLAKIAYIRGLLGAGQGDAALAQAQALVRAAPGSPDALLALGDTLWALGRVGAATDAYARAADLRFDEPALLRLIEGMDRTGRRDDARRALALFLSQNPRDIAARRLAAHWQVAAGDWGAAIATLKGLRASLGNRDAVVFAELALAWTGKGDADRARRFGAAAYRLAPDDPAVVDAYARALRAAGDRDGARQLRVKADALGR